MKTWAETESSPEFVNAPSRVKEEVRGFYKKKVQSQDDFKELPDEEKEAVLRRIDGDADYTLRTAAVLVLASKKEVLGRAIVDPKEKDELEDALRGAKAAEKYLDVPLKERAREPFQDEIPGHLDKPLRALLGFMDDALPEYVGYKFWQTRAGESLEDRLRNVLALSNTQAPVPVDLNAAMNLDGFIRSYEELDRRLPTILPPLRQWSPEAQEKQLTTDAEAALKHGLPQIRWLAPDRAVQTALVHLLAGLKQGLPRAFRPDSVRAICASVKQKAFELLARQMYHLPSPNGPIPIDPEHVAETILAASALAPVMDQVADDFPSLFAVAAGLAAVPRAAQSRYNTFLQQEVGAPLTPDLLLRAVSTGSFSLIKLSNVDEMLFREAATAAGARPDAVAHFVRDTVTAAQKPMLSALATRSATMDTADFKKAQAGIRQKLAVEVAKKTKAPPTTPPPPDLGDEGYREAINSLFPDHRVELIHFPFYKEEEDAPITPKTAPDAKETPEPAQEAPADAPAEAPREGALTAHLRAHPISAAAVKKGGLARDFAHFPMVLTKTGGSTPEAAVQEAVAIGALHAKSTVHDLLDALERDQRGAAAPPPGAKAGADLPPDAPASPLSAEMLTPAPVEEPPKETEKMSQEMSKAPEFTVKVVEVDPASLIPTKTPGEIEPSRIRGVQQRFTEGKGYPAVTARETKRGLELIDGHHRTMVAKERGDTLKAVVISEADYEALKEAGIGHTEICYLMLAKAGQYDAMKHLRQQYPQKKL